MLTELGRVKHTRVLPPGSIGTVFTSLKPVAKVVYLFFLPYKEVDLSVRDIAKRLGYPEVSETNPYAALVELETEGLLEYLGTPQQGKQTPFRLRREAAPIGFKGRKFKALPKDLHGESPTVQASYLYLLGTPKSHTTPEVEDALGVSYIGAYRALRRLLELDLVTTDPTTKPQHFRVVEDG